MYTLWRPSESLCLTESFGFAFPFPRSEPKRAIRTLSYERAKFLWNHLTPECRKLTLIEKVEKVRAKLKECEHASS